MENQIEIYQNQQNEVEIQVRFENDSFWLSQRLMAELFDKDSDTIGLHLKIFMKRTNLTNLQLPSFSR